MVNNICPIYNRNLGPESVTNLANFCDKLGGYWRGTCTVTCAVLSRKYSRLLRQLLWKIITRIRLIVENNPQPPLPNTEVKCSQTRKFSELLHEFLQKLHAPAYSNPIYGISIRRGHIRMSSLLHKKLDKYTPGSKVWRDTPGVYLGTNLPHGVGDLYYKRRCRGSLMILPRLEKFLGCTP